MNHMEMRRRLLNLFLGEKMFIFLPNDKFVTKITKSRSFTYMILKDGDVFFIVHEAQDDSSLENEKYIVTMDPDSELIKFTRNEKIFSMHEKLNGIKTDFLDPSPAFKKPFDDEIPIIREGIKKMVESFNDFISNISIGEKENEIRAEIDYRLLKKGFDDFIFPTVISAGPRTSVPLGRTGDKVVEKGDVILVDMGALYKGYEISISRVIFTDFNDDLKDLWNFYNGVFEFSSRHFFQGKSCNEIDMVSREYLGKRNFSYPHYTGYPAGGFSSPYIYPGSNDKLERNSIFIFSPGIYIKGKYGFRVKRTVLIKDHGFEAIDE